MNGSARRAGAFAAFACLIVACARDGSARWSDEEKAVLAASAGDVPAPPVPSFAAGPAPAIARTVAASARASVSVELPARADRPFRVVDRGSGVGAAVRAIGASPVAGVVGARAVRFPGAVAGAELVHALVSDGAEDSIVLASPPASGVLRWSFEPTSAVAGLRLVDGVLELLDARGAPRLRVDRPFTVDAAGVRRAASLEVEGCAVDRSPAPPWGRVMKRPEASCMLVVRFDAVSPRYPLVVDPVWRTTASMAVARVGHAAVKLNAARVLVAGGGGPDPLSSAEVFDLATATWAMTAARPSIGFSPPVKLASGAWFFVGAPSAIYDEAAGTWIPKAAPAAARYNAPVVKLLDGRVLVAGGIVSLPSTYTSTTEIYAPATDAWSTAAPMPEARFTHAAVTLASGKVFVAGGQLASPLPPPKASLLYDLATDAWTSAAAMPGDSWVDPALLLPDGRVFTTYGAPQIYDPTTDLWATTTPPARSFAAASAMMSNGSVLIAGGFTDSGALVSTAELYDPTHDTYAPLGALVVRRTFAVATPLASGVLLTGGDDGSSAHASASAEILGDAVDGAACLASAECLATSYCAGSTCAPMRALGAFATDPASCASGFVADGVCCDTACTGTCAACDLDASKGTCTAVAGAAKHGTCDAATAGDPCTARVCDGKERSTCAGFVGAEIDCRDHACASGVETLAATCDGKGACAAVVTKTCSPYACDGKQCRSTCRGDADCASGAKCDVTTHACVPPVCVDDHTATGPTGLPLDCSPFRCATGACRTRCASTDECLNAYNCDVPSGRCVAAGSTAQASQDTGGCGLSSGASAGPAGALFGLCAALAMLARRARRA